jgi:hypothetical protein
MASQTSEFNESVSFRAVREDVERGTNGERAGYIEGGTCPVVATVTLELDERNQMSCRRRHHSDVVVR